MLSKRNLRTFSLRFLLVLITLFAASVGSWSKPYALRGYYPNGNVAWEQTERRTLAFGIDVTGRTTWFPTGELAGEWTPNSNTYYSPAGEAYSGTDAQRIREWGRRYGNLFPLSEVENYDERPLEPMLLRFNPKLPKLKLSI